MTVEEILKLLDAGYTKDEINSFGKPADEPKPDPKPDPKPKDEAKPEEPKPKEEPKENTQIDYAKLSMELMKAVAGMDTGHSPNHKSKDELCEDAILSFVK